MNKFKFTCDSDGVLTSSEFEAETWIEALEQFQYFLKGIGYIFDGELGLVEEEAIFNAYNTFGGTSE
jgi:hypothetical protein